MTFKLVFHSVGVCVHVLSGVISVYEGSEDKLIIFEVEGSRKNFISEQMMSIISNFVGLS